MLNFIEFRNSFKPKTGECTPGWTATFKEIGRVYIEVYLSEKLRVNFTSSEIQGAEFTELSELITATYDVYKLKIMEKNK